jgi:hypothetical protein
VSAHAALADDVSAARLARPRRELDVIDGLAGLADGPATTGPLTAEAVGRVVAAAVTAFLRERFPVGVRISSRLGYPELDQLAAELDTALARAWGDLDGLARLASGPGTGDAGRAPPGLALSAGPAATLADGGICAMFAVDIAGFTRPSRDDDIRRHVHEQLYEMQRKAFDGAGIPWAGCWHEDRGDGTLVVLPPGLSGQGLVGSVPERLRGLVRRHNHVSCDTARIQLRTAAHVGLVEHDGHGFVGSDVNLLFRMLDSGALKRALAGSRADLALIVSDYVYDSLVRRHPSLVGPDVFEAVRCQVKKTRFRAWTCLPGRL